MRMPEIDLIPAKVGFAFPELVDWPVEFHPASQLKFLLTFLFAKLNFLVAKMVSIENRFAAMYLMNLYCNTDQPYQRYTPRVYHKSRYGILVR